MARASPHKSAGIRSHRNKCRQPGIHCESLAELDSSGVLPEEGVLSTMNEAIVAAAMNIDMLATCTVFKVK